MPNAQENGRPNQNPAKDLQEFVESLLHFHNGGLDMLTFFSERYEIQPPDQLVVMKMMFTDMQLAYRAIKATESALGDRSGQYLQWKDNVLTSFSRINLESPVDHVRSGLHGDTRTHLDYCVSRLDEMVPDDDLQALLTLIGEFRHEATSLNLGTPVVQTIHRNLQDLEDLAWDHYYRLEADRGAIGKIAFRLRHVLHGDSPRKLGRFVSGLWQVLWRVYVYTNAGQNLLPEAERWVKGLLPAAEE